MRLLSCREVDICSLECMRAFWPAHRESCKKLAADPEIMQLRKRYSKWLDSLMHPLLFALPSAFDVASTPDNLETKILMLELGPAPGENSFEILDAELVDLADSHQGPVLCRRSPRLRAS